MMVALTDDIIKQGRILIIDDEVSSLCLLENVLQRLGFRFVRTLADPQRVIAEMEDFRPDLVITDLTMPELGGVQLIRLVRSHFADNAALPILVLTGSVRSLAKQDSLRAGATDILFKPFDPSEMLMRVRSVLLAYFLHLQIQEQNRELERRVAEGLAELQQALTALQESQRQIVQQERFRAFGEMAGGVVHDFNNALMSVIGYSELLLEDDELFHDRDLARKYLTTINTAGQDASQVVSRLRDFYRPREAGDVFAPTNLNQLIEEAVPRTRPKWHDRALESGRTIKVELELQKVPLVMANAAELREVITSMICNAVDAMPDGGTITIRTAASNEMVRMMIADTGIGMNEEVRTRCLEPFFTTKGDHGTGLGLSMSYGIVRRHEGKLDIDSIEGIGTTFRLEFPSCQRAQPGTDVAAVKAGFALRVLIVDDDPVSLEVVSRYLRADGHQVAATVSAEEALQRLQKEPYDLLVTDQGMPGMSGLQLAGEAKRIWPAMAIILVTGFGPSAEQEASAADGILRKPLNRDELRQSLQRVVKPKAPVEEKAPAGMTLEAAIA